MLADRGQITSRRPLVRSLGMMSRLSPYISVLGSVRPHCRASIPRRTALRPQLRFLTMASTADDKLARTDPATVPNPLGEGKYIKWVD
jgi:hypothetical protein